MGGIVSRISSDVTFDHGLNESFNRLKNSFDKTPKYKMINDKMVDPRSATLEVNRTPLCLLDLAEEEGSTPVTRNKKKWKRRSASRISDLDSTQSTDVFNQSSVSSQLSDSSAQSRILPWEHLDDLVEDETKSPDTKFEIVVEELRECLSKVTMTPVYVDEESPDNRHKVDTPPPDKDLKKKLFWTPDTNLAPNSPSNNKERTPLGLVNSNVTNCNRNSSALWRGGKIWRVPADERAKLQGENTPPSLPPFGLPCSAPPGQRHQHFPLK